MASIEALSTREGLSAVVGPVVAVGREPLATAGKSAATLERLAVRLGSGAEVSLVLKRNRVAADWVARRSEDRTGREAARLGAAGAQGRLAGVWDVFRCPYRAYAVEDGAFGLLMDDLSVHLLPPAGQPISEADEDAVLGALAALHARYWHTDLLGQPDLQWLATPAQRFALFCAHAVGDPSRPPFPADFAEWVPQGWAAAFAGLPRRVVDRLSQPADVLARACEGLPWTLVHGDARLVNFAVEPDGRVVAFDWALTGWGPAGLDLGWYLIGNPGRHVRPKAAVLARYRALLEQALGAPLPEALWERTVALAVLSGAAALLWDRALDLEDGAPGARAEWAWWADRLAALV